jgi:polyisoprenoid-binding protein YceI
MTTTFRYSDCYNNYCDRKEISMSETTTISATRTVDGVEVPSAGTWAIDKSHSHVGFSVRHLGVAKTRGRFGDFDGTVVVAERPEDSTAEVTIAAASVDTRDETRDGHLRSGDFLDAETFPNMTFRSTAVRRDGRGWKIDGELTIKDVTRTVTLDAEFDGAEGDPWGGTRAAFSATTELNREDFGLTWNQVLESGGLLVGKTVKVELEVELVRQ